MAEPDEIIHQALRLKIMAALYATRNHPLEFARLKPLVGATDGNLGSHLSTLEKAGYVRMMKDIFRNKPRTRALITPVGAHALRRHIDYLRAIIAAVDKG